jgi:hypothetical protein
MKFIIFFIIFFVVSCSPKNKAYICDGKKCANTKEANEYFKKKHTIEVEIKDKKKDKSIDLVKLNTKDLSENDELKIKNTNKNIKVNNKKQSFFQKQKLAAIKRSEAIKKEKEQKKLLKIRNKEKVEQIKNNKKIVKLPKKDNSIKKSAKTVDENLFIKNTKCFVLGKCDIEDISKKIMDKGRNKDYPDITIK